MKKLLPVLALAILGFSACNKCSECTLKSAIVKDDFGNEYYLWTDGTVRSLPEGHPADSSATYFGVTCSNDLEDCIDGEYRKYCGTDGSNVQQQPYLVSGLTDTDSLFTAEYTYECK